MKLSVAQELRQPGRVGRSHMEEDIGHQEYLGRALSFASPLIIDSEHIYDGEGFNVRGTITTRLNSECALCGKPFIEELSVEFDERFVREPGEDDECYGYSGEALDIGQMVLDNLFLNLPVFSKCSEGCKGLCPVCGCDLNTVQCSCVREEVKDNPFAALEQLLYHDKEV